MTHKRATVEDIVAVPEKTEERLNQRQLVDYRDYRERLIKWVLHLGKNPEKAEGYAWNTTRQRCYRIDQFYRWIWDQEGGYTLNATTDHAEEYTKELVYADYSNTHKAGFQKSIQTLFKHQRHEQGKDVEWMPSIKFSNYSGTHNARDFLTRDERRKLKEAVLEYGSIPHYDAVTPEQRNRWKQHLAQRFEKPKSDVTRKDWDRANGWKYPSILWVSMDAGLRPKEVARATTDWLDIENGMLRISKQDSTMNTDNWNVGLSDRTTNILQKWVAERENYDKYADSEQLWLTKYANPYGSEALNRLLRNLCEGASIPVDDRDISWYSIRHSVGTYMSRDNGLAAAQAQLRHRSERTTMRYDQAPVEDRKKTLNSWD